jgi:uncharacterized delta-60 repeat protein
LVLGQGYGWYGVRSALAADGDLDSGFGTGGIVTTSLSGTDSGDVDFDAYGNSLALLASGKYLVAGSYFDGPTVYDAGYGMDVPDGYYDLFVARYCTDGQLDNGSNCGTPGFGTGGVATMRVSSTKFSQIFRVNLGVLSDGTIAVVGDLPYDSSIFMARFTSNGSVDTSFGGGDGLVVLGYNYYVRDMAVLAGDQILVAGYGVSSGSNSLVVVKLNSDGSLDTSFSTDGISMMKIGGGATTINAMALPSDGTIILGGYTSSGGDKVVLLRLTSNGDLDTTFSSGDGTNGYYVNDLSVNNDAITGLALQSDDKILATGYRNSTSPNADFFLMRFNSDGSLDTDFDGDSGSANGIVITNVAPGANDIPKTIHLQTDGKIIVGGVYENASEQQALAIVRYTSTGAIDTTFGTNGIVKNHINQDSYNYDTYGQGALSSDGKLVVAGSFGYTDYDTYFVYSDVFVVRYGGFSSNVTISGNAGIGAATLSYDNGGAKTATAVGSGDYSFTVPSGWSGTVTPSKTGFTFSPESNTYSNVTSDQSDEDYTVSTCTAQTSGNWSAVFASCPSGAKHIIPSGRTVTLDIDLSLAGDLEVQSGGGFDPNGKTVTLTGSTAQTLTGNPLTFYRLTIAKTNATDTVTISGKLKVTKKLTISKGKLTSASDYEDIQIDEDGELELTSDITVSGSFTNSGTLTTDGWGITFDGGVEQHLALNVLTGFDDLTVSTGTTLVETVTDDNAYVGGTLTNEGVIRKTQPVDSATQYYFGLAGSYAGGDMEIDVTTRGDLTSLQVDRTDADHDSSPSGKTTGIWWSITPTNSGFTATLTLPHDNLADPMACRYVSGTSWDCERSSFDSTSVTRQDLTDFSEWAVFDGAPTAVDLAGFTATAGSDAILLQWETASELDILGFALYRAGSPDGVRTRLNEGLIPGQAPGSPVGSSYRFVDKNVVAGTTYYYWLEGVDVYGSALQRGPIWAQVQPAHQENHHFVFLPMIHE